MEDIKVSLKTYLPEKRAGEQRDQQLKKACREFESLFTYEILKSMRRTVEKCDLFHGGHGEEIYESFLDQELAKNAAGSGPNSLSHQLYQQLQRKDASRMAGGESEGSHEEAALSPLNAQVSSGFGWRKDPLNGQVQFHQGVDLAAEGGTLIRASLPGRVLESGYRDGYGNVVVLDHGEGLTTLYAHNQDNLVSHGDQVRKGSPLARVGSTGRSTGTHLHFEVRKDGKAVDPGGLLRPGPHLRI